MSSAPSPRWKALFADLEARLEAAEAAELAGEVADRTRRSRAEVPLEHRLQGAVGGTPLLHVGVEGAGRTRGRLLDCGPGWLLLAEHGLAEQGSREALVPLAAVLTVSGLGLAASRPSPVARRLDLRWALRGLARDRSPVALVLRDGTTLSGTLDAVGADVLDLAVHPPDEPRRRAEVQDVALVPLAALALVRRS